MQILLSRSGGEEYQVPEVPETLARAQRAMASGMESARNRPVLSLSATSTVLVADLKQAKKRFLQAATFISSSTSRPLGVVFVRTGERRLGLAWLPNAEPREDWIRGVVDEWRSVDPAAFGSARDWTKDKRWRGAEELSVLSDLESLNAERLLVVSEIETRERALIQQLEQAERRSIDGEKRLLTAQDHVLVDAVATALRDFGYQVEDVDSLLSPGAPKREDLRIKMGDGEALAEVRGYEKGGAKTSDLSRLQRFSALYAQETGQLPLKLIYVVNGQFRVAPDMRPRPLQGSQEDLALFSAAGGLVIATEDLFILHRERNRIGTAAICRYLSTAVGLLDPDDLLKGSA
jgi:hypothetical protein